MVNFRGPTPFIILGKARSGSTYLLSLLNSHSQVQAFGELFREKGRIGWDVQHYGTEWQSPALIHKMNSDPIRFLEEDVFIEHRPNLAAVGFKIFYYHAQEEPQSIVWSYLQSRTDLRVIHLKRQNTLRELLSLRLAEQTDEWVTLVDREDTAAPIALEYTDCVREFKYARDIKERFDRFFKGSAVLELTYENLTQDVESETKRVQRFLQLSPLKLSAATVKQAKRTLREAITNYSELKRAFCGTSWEAYFDE